MYDFTEDLDTKDCYGSEEKKSTEETSAGGRHIYIFMALPDYLFSPLTDCSHARPARSA